MNREIKFRAWNKKEKYMEIVDDLQMFSNDLSIGIPSKDYFLRKDDVELMQYTGLHDKNGKEIYEGDIVKITGSKEIDIGKVIYEYDGFTVDVMNMDRFYGRVHLLEKFTEVIGNVFENGDILNDSKNTEKN